MTIASNLNKVRARIDAACRACGRDPRNVTLIGASKTKPASDIRAAAALGLSDFGENYVDEALDKIASVADDTLTWHFIGRVQSNKTRAIATHFDWVHTLDRAKIARRLNEQRGSGAPLSVLIQVNADNDPAKAGVPASSVAALAAEIAALPHLRLRGLMTILARHTDPAAGYQSVAQCFAELETSLDPEHRLHWDTLSMGMTADLEQAIAAGATHIRIGTALFGARDAQA